MPEYQDTDFDVRNKSQIITDLREAGYKGRIEFQNYWNRPLDHAHYGFPLAVYVYIDLDPKSRRALVIRGHNWLKIRGRVLTMIAKSNAAGSFEFV